MDEKSTPSMWSKLIKYNDLPHPPSITLVTIAGNVFFNGSLEDFRKQRCCISQNVNCNNFPNDTHPVYLVGSTIVKTLQELIDLVDWTQPELLCTIIFQPGNFHDICEFLYYDKWYEANGWIRAIKDTSFVYVCKEMIPDSWKLDESGRWWRQLSNSTK